MRATLRIAALIVCLFSFPLVCYGQVFDNTCPVGQSSIVPMRTVNITTGHFNDTVCSDIFGNLTFLSLNPSLSASDTFTRANGALGSNWKVTQGTVTISSNNAANGSNNDIAIWADPAFVSTAQFSQVTTTGSAAFSGAVVRGSNNNPNSGVGYSCFESTTTINLLRITGSVSSTTLATAASTGVSGDVLRLEIDASNNLTCYKNGVSTLTATDATFRTGSPGVGGANGGSENNWSGGNLPVNTGTGPEFSKLGCRNLSNIRCVDSSNTAGWTGADACGWINSAIADLGTALGIVDARGLSGGSTSSTCTSGTITVPQNIALLLSGTIFTNANPGISGTGGLIAGGVASGVYGTGRANTLFQCTATTGSFCVVIGNGVNIMRGFTLSDMKIIADAGGGVGGSTIRIRDGANHLTMRNLQLGPTQSCVVFETGSIGQQFQEWDSVRCDGFGGIGFNANLAAGTGGTNLQLTNVYMNGSGGVSPTIGFDIEKWVGVTINSSDSDNAPTGFLMANAGGTGSATLNAAHCETTSTVCFSLGAGSYTLASPGCISCAQMIDVTAVADISIHEPFSSATSGGNDIVFEAGAAGGNYVIFGGSSRMSKPTILANGGTVFQQFNGPQMTQSIGVKVAPSAAVTLNLNEAGTGSAGFALSRGGGITHTIINEGTAGNNCTGSAQDDLCYRENAHAVIISTNNGSNATLKVTSGNGVVQFATSNAAGTTQNLSHVVQDTATLAAGTVTVTFTGAAVFTNATSYTCIADDDTAVAATRVLQNSGTSITITGTGTDVIRFICIGN